MTDVPVWLQWTLSALAFGIVGVLGVIARFMREFRYDIMRLKLDATELRTRLVEQDKWIAEMRKHLRLEVDEPGRD